MPSVQSCAGTNAFILDMFGRNAVKWESMPANNNVHLYASSPIADALSALGKHPQGFVESP
jgi:hypothetical protein